LLFIVSGASFISKKIKEQEHTPWIRDPRSGKNSSRIPDPGGKKAPDLGSRIWICNTDPQANVPVCGVQKSELLR
jgi:hypothetical protein